MSEFTPWIGEDTYVNDFSTGKVQEIGKKFVLFISIGYNCVDLDRYPSHVPCPDALPLRAHWERFPPLPPACQSVPDS